ncbi:MAG: hypothetical protein LBP76_08935 [Treponema sp.]|jgi:hypothetical protein|nr:hypothetical protein [Treponema sp.]
MQRIKFLMKELFFYLLGAGILLCNACAAKQAKLPEMEDELVQSPKPINVYDIINYKDMEDGAEIPVWVSQYLNEGVLGVETLDEYRDRYVFIVENTGINFRTLQQWSAAFSLYQDFPRRVASRIEKRLLNAANQYPDDEYGDFFEASVKAASDTYYRGAARERDFWLLLQYFEEDGVTVGPESYIFLVLISADKSFMQNQILQILNNLELEHKPDKDQTSAINRIKENFFENF